MLIVREGKGGGVHTVLSLYSSESFGHTTGKEEEEDPRFLDRGSIGRGECLEVTRALRRPKEEEAMRGGGDEEDAVRWKSTK
jgi:hypothetical protein